MIDPKFGAVLRAEGPNGEILLSWDVGDAHELGEHHFEIERHTDGDVHFFYRNRLTGRLEDFGFDEKTDD